MTKFPGWRTMTGAQRRNAKMDAMFDRARRQGHATFDAFKDAALKAGWALDHKTDKWWNPLRDDGARYCNTERAFRYICEDYHLA